MVTWSRVAAVQTKKWMDLRYAEEGTVPLHLPQGKRLPGNP